MNAYIKFGEILSSCSQDIERQRNFGIINQRRLLWSYVPKMKCNNPRLDLVNMNAYIKFGEKMSVGSQDI